MEMEDDIFGKNDLVLKYEQQLEAGEAIYFDLQDFQEISDYYSFVNNYHDAILALRYADNCFPDLIEVQLNMVDLMIEGKLLVDAALQLDKLNSQYAHNADVLLYFGYYHLVNEDLFLAEEYFERALTVKDANKEDILTYIIDKFTNVDDTRCVSYLLRAIQLCPEANFVVDLAECYGRLKDYDNAEKHYQLAIDEDTFSPYLWSCLGAVYVNKLDYTKALEAFDFALTLDETHFESCRAKTKCLLELKQKEACILFIQDTVKHFQELSSDFSVTIIHNSFVEILMDFNEWESAQTELNQLLFFYSYPPAQLNLAKCYMHLNEIEKALACIEKALEGNEDQGNYWKAKAFIYVTDKNYDEALFCFFVGYLFNGGLDQSTIEPLKNILKMYSFADLWDSTLVRFLSNELLLARFDEERIRSEYRAFDSCNANTALICELVLFLSQLKLDWAIECLAILADENVNALVLLIAEIEGDPHYQSLFDAIPSLNIPTNR